MYRSDSAECHNFFRRHMLGVAQLGDYCNIGYLSENHIKFKSSRISYFHNIHVSCKSFWLIAQSTAASLPCSAQNFKTIWQLLNELSANDSSRDLILRCLSDAHMLYCISSVLNSQHMTSYKVMAFNSQFIESLMTPQHCVPWVTHLGPGHKMKQIST